MKLLKYTGFMCLLLFAITVKAQNGKVKKADKKFENLAYIDALEIYKDIAEKGYEDEAVYRKLGDSYYFNASYLEASKWYRKLQGVQGNLSPEYKFRYGQSLKAIGSYEEADVQLKDFFRSQGMTYESSGEYLQNIEDISYQYLVNKVAFNTNTSDYPAFLNSNGLYVISGSDNNKKTPWNNEPTSDIFKLEGDNLETLEGDVNTKFNEGSIAITKDGATLFFTRNDYNERKRGRDSNKITRLKLYRSIKTDEKWGKAEELPFNDSEYSVGHPALSPDGKILYFVSDMPSIGNMGGTDIYAVDLGEDGSLGTPTNMKAFNTPGNEMFPYVAADGTFYFASNGYVSNLGGLDIYSSKPQENNGYGEVVNLGKPVNSAMDDFAMMMDPETQKGYLASNRSGTQSDDIYSVVPNENYETPCVVAHRGVVRDKDTGNPIENSIVSLIDANNKVIAQQVAPAGLYEFEERDCKDAKFVRAEKNDYQSGEELVAEPKNGWAITDVYLEKQMIDLSVGVDLGKLLNPIYFDLDKSFIRPDAEIELQKIVSIMQEHPTLKIDVRSHTDSRADDNYNVSLSNRRVRATIEYIVANGISRSRLTGRGYGERELVNGCSNGITCSEDEHQRNRRSEFIIVEQ